MCLDICVSLFIRLFYFPIFTHLGLFVTYNVTNGSGAILKQHATKQYREKQAQIMILSTFSTVEQQLLLHTGSEIECRREDNRKMCFDGLK